MVADEPPKLLDARKATAYRIAEGDAVKLAPLHLPDVGYDASVFLEIWEPGGSQPPNGHPRSVETFFFLAGRGTAYCDDAVVDVEAGQLLLLPPRSLHRIENTGDAKLFAVTTMTPDDGFAALVLGGVPTEVTAEELVVLGWAGAGPRSAPGR